MQKNMCNMDVHYSIRIPRGGLHLLQQSFHPSHTAQTSSNISLISFETGEQYFNYCQFVRFEQYEFAIGKFALANGWILAAAIP